MPQITEIIVGAGRTFNDPYEQYANFKPSVTIKATLQEGEDAATVVKELQRKAEAWMFEHKALMLDEIRKIEQLQEAQKRAYHLENTLKAAQEELQKMKQKNPEFFKPMLATGDASELDL